ncbi:hypothetical protein SUGI_0790070 [Cryptomeria japonica]|nr:hypothetical protein SUGI_0790070 [Cryptomeria japonica]
MLHYAACPVRSSPTIYNSRFFYPVPCKFKSTSHARRISFKSSESSVGTETQTNNEDTPTVEEEIKPSETTSSAKASSLSIDKELKKVVQKTAGTFAPRASTAQKNPAVPGTTLYLEAHGNVVDLDVHNSFFKSA